MSEQQTPIWKSPQAFDSSNQPLPNTPQPNVLDTKTILIHVGLFVLTFGCVSLAGASFVGFQSPLFPLVLPDWTDFLRGALFAALLLGFLGVHEFGHYFASLFHKIRVTLPYFIPVPFGIGTLGAVIRIKQRINDSRQMFDVGAAGPLAGFVVALCVLLYGFFTLPDPTYIMQFQGHEAIQQFVRMHGHYPQHLVGGSQGGTLIIGNTLLYSFLAQFFQNVPPMWEMYHYPFLFAGWLGLFFTALNLTPVGQLDGGHILYSLIGFKKHRSVARVFFAVLVTLAGIEAIPFIHLMLGDWDSVHGALSLLVWTGILFLLLSKAYHKDQAWMIPVLLGSLAISAGYLYFVTDDINTAGSLIWVFWSFFIAFLVGVEHPPALHEHSLDPARTFWGWFSMILFVLCISPNPLYVI